MTIQLNFMIKNQKKPMQQDMKFDPSKESKYACAYCGHHADMSMLQVQLNEYNKQKTAQFNKDMAKWNRFTPKKKKTEKTQATQRYSATVGGLHVLYVELSWACGWKWM